MRVLSVGSVAALAVLVCSCSDGGGVGRAVRNPAPTLTSLFPDAVEPGRPGATVILNGGNFVQTSVAKCRSPGPVLARDEAAGAVALGRVGVRIARLGPVPARRSSGPDHRRVAAAPIAAAIAWRAA